MCKKNKIEIPILISSLVALIFFLTLKTYNKKVLTKGQYDVSFR